MTKELGINVVAAEQKGRAWLGTWIPKELYLCNLSWPEKILWTEILYLSKEGNYGCIASNEYFAQFLGCSEASIVRYISNLKSLGMVETIGFDGRTRSLIANEEPLRMLAARLIEEKNNTKKPINPPTQIDYPALSQNMPPTQIDYPAYSNCLANNKESNNKESLVSFNKLKEPIMEVQRPPKYDKEKTSRNNQSDKIKSTKYKRAPSRNTTRQIGLNHIPNIIRNEWNSCPSVTSHRVDPGNKTYEQIKDTILSLFNGTFMKKKHWDENWIKTIPEEYKTKKWSVPEVRQVISDATKYSIEGYWPENKISGFKNLLNVLYNPRTSKSMFLQTAINPPKLLSEVINENDNEFSTDDYICGMQEVILEEIDPEKNKSFSMSRFERAVKEIKKDYDNVDLVGELKYDAGSARDYAALYASFIRKAWKTISPEQIGVRGACYRKFQAYIKQQYYQ